MNPIERIEFLFLRVQETHAAGIAGAVDEVVYFLAAKSLECLLDADDKCVEDAGITRIQLERYGLAASFLEQADDLVGSRPVRVVGEDRRDAATGEHICGGESGRASRTERRCQAGEFAGPAVHVYNKILNK